MATSELQSSTRIVQTAPYTWEKEHVTLTPNTVAAGQRDSVVRHKKHFFISDVFKSCNSWNKTATPSASQNPLHSVSVLSVLSASCISYRIIFIIVWWIFSIFSPLWKMWWNFAKLNTMIQKIYQNCLSEMNTSPGRNGNSIVRVGKCARRIPIPNALSTSVNPQLSALVPVSQHTFGLCFFTSQVIRKLRNESRFRSL